MKLSLKLISLLLAAIFLIAGTAAIAYADVEEDPVDPGIVDDPGTDDPAPGGDDDPGPGTDDPAPGGTDDPAPGGTDDPYTGGTDDPYTGGDDDTGSGSSYTPEYQDDPLFFGDAGNYDYNSGDSGADAGSVADQTTLFKSSGVNDAEVAPVQWNAITLDEKEITTGVADFKSIKQSTTSENTTKWILYIGFVLIALAVLGILYFIVATASARSANKSYAAEYYRTADPAPVRSTAGRIEEKERRAERASASRTSHFADEGSKSSRRVSSKADTGEIYIPRRTRK